MARTITLRLSDEAYEAVRRHADADHTSMNSWIETVLDAEDMRRRCMAHAAWLEANPAMSRAARCPTPAWFPCEPSFSHLVSIHFYNININLYDNVKTKHTITGTVCIVHTKSEIYFVAKCEKVFTIK